MKSTVQFKLTEDQINSLEPLAKKLFQARETGKLGMVVAQILLYDEFEAAEEVRALFIEPKKVPAMFKIFGLPDKESVILELIEMYYGEAGSTMYRNSLKEGLSPEEAFNQLIELL